MTAPAVAEMTDLGDLSPFLAKAKQLRAAGASIEQIKGYLATKGHITENGFTPFTNAPPEAPEDTRNVLSRAGSDVLSLVRQTATHSIDTAAGLVTAPFKSFSQAMAPGSEQDVADLNRIGMTGKGGGKGMLPFRSSSIATPGQRAAGVAQTLANVVAPELANTVGGRVVQAGASRAAGGLAGLSAAGGVAGAAYNPDDPAAGFLTGATVAPALKAVGGGLADVASRVKNAPPGAVRDLALSAVPARMLKAASAFRKLTPEDGPVDRPPTAEGYQSPIEAAGQGQIVPPGARSRQSIPSPTVGGNEVPPSLGADPNGLSEAEKQELLRLGVDPEKIAQARVQPAVTTESPVMKVAQERRSSRIAAASRSRVPAPAAAADPEALGVHGGMENTPIGGRPPSPNLQRILDALTKQSPAGEVLPTYGDAEEAMGLAPHQQPDLEDLLRRSLALKRP